ncbi:MAG: glutaredoxin [Bradymonadales bacterium]|nr:MAG: glutaredoxin [Bradymonadales bacterium]
MKAVKVYTKTFCPFCDRAKALLKARGISFSEENLDSEPEKAKALFERTGFRTVPQIFFGEDCIGGFQELAQLDAEQNLVDLLKEPSPERQ